MKKCSKCSAMWDDKVAFCGNCGGALEAVADNDEKSNENTVAAVPVTAQDDAAYQTTNKQADENSCIPQETDAQKPKNKKKFMLPLLIGSASLVLVVVIIGFCTNWFGLTAPLNGLFKAVQNMTQLESVTVKAGDNTTRYIIDSENEEITAVSKSGYRTECEYNGTVYFYDNDGYAYIYTDDDSSEFFETKEKYGDVDNIDWEDFVDDTDLDDYLKSDEMSGFVDDLFDDYLSDKDWLEEYLGFERDGDDYIFEPDLDKLPDELIRICDESDAVTRKGKKDFEKLVDDEFENTDDVTIRVTITVESGYITRLEIEEDYPSGSHGEVIKFSDFNETEISEDEIDEIKDKTEQLIADHQCDECGGWFEDAEDKHAPSHGDCHECGEHFSYMNEYSGYYYCDDCYEKQVPSTPHSLVYSGSSSGRCWNCNIYKSTRYEYLCYDCYKEASGYCRECGDYALVRYADLCEDCRFNY